MVGLDMAPRRANATKPRRGVRGEPILAVARSKNFHK
jgi:hypothetical protein